MRDFPAPAKAVLEPVYMIVNQRSAEGKITFETRKNTSNVFLLISNVVSELSGRFFMVCIREVSQNGEIHPYALPVYSLKSEADDVKAVFAPL
jgi:hypothetical protein